jgi:hypothetical protein
MSIVPCSMRPSETRASQRLFSHPSRHTHFLELFLLKSSSRVRNPEFSHMPRKKNRWGTGHGTRDYCTTVPRTSVADLTVRSTVQKVRVPGTSTPEKVRAPDRRRSIDRSISAFLSSPHNNPQQHHTDRISITSTSSFRDTK